MSITSDMLNLIDPKAKEILDFLEPPKLPSMLEPFSYIGLGDFPIEERQFESDIFQFDSTEQTMLIQPKRDLLTGKIISYGDLPISTLSADTTDINRHIGSIDDYHRGAALNVPFYFGLAKPEPKSSSINFQPLIESLDSGINLLINPFSDIVENSSADQENTEPLPDLPTICEATVVPNPRANENEEEDSDTEFQCINDTLDVHDINKLIPKMAYEFKFKLDDFQARSIYRVENHECVFVSAPTSAGKTVVAQYAIALCRLHKMRVIYTSPIKALSNQKFREFLKDFGDVGIITGDVSVNREASILIMTTEILRSMLYKGADVLRDVECVIFDECHYISDVERGVVWEESIILMPPHINMVFLSATMPNCDEIASWIAKSKHRPVYVEYHDKRPVPLSHSLFVNGKIFNIAAPSKINPDQTDFNTNNYSRSFQFYMHPTDGRQRLPANLNNSVYWITLIESFKTNNMLPALIFSFKTQLCDNYAVYASRMNLITEQEKSKVVRFFNKAILRLDEKNRKLPQVQRIFELVQKGIGVHHSGLLPILKEIVEILLSEGLIKILFCTSSFAMGINAPVRTCAFTSLQKYDGKELKDLTMSEYLQMSGRAGRRGLDKVGNTVLIAYSKDFPTEDELRHLFCGKAEEINSQFKIRFNMILNMIRVEGMNIVEILKRSLTAHKVESEGPRFKAKLDALHDQLKSISKIENCLQTSSHHSQMNSNDIEDVEMGSPIKDFVINSYKLTEINKKMLKTFEQKIIKSFKPNFFVLYVTPKSCEIALIEKSNTSQYNSNIIEISLYTSSGRSLIIRSTNELPNLHLLAPAQESITLLSDEARRLAFNTFDIASESIPYSKIIKDNSIEFLQDSNTHHKLLIQMVKSPCFKCASLIDHYEIGYRAHSFRKQIKETSEKFEDDKIAFIPLLQGYMNMLKNMKYLTDDNLITLKGRAAIEMSSADEIISTELLYNGFFAQLTTAQIAAFASCLVTQKRPKADCLPDLDEENDNLLRFMINTAKYVADQMYEYGVPSDEDYITVQVNHTYFMAIYQWTAGMDFDEVMKNNQQLSEGSVTYSIVKTHELLKNFSNAANLLSLKTLAEKFDAAAEAIKRDIILAGSLYLD